MRRLYSIAELQALASLIRKYGHLTYGNPANVEDEFFNITGVHRASGPLYMAAWRLERGYYDNLLAA